jgi:hypothetical protein
VSAVRREVELAEHTPAPSGGRTLWGRTLAVFAVACAVYLLTWRGHVAHWSGMLRAGPGNLAVLQAEAWLHGRLDVDCPPDRLDTTTVGEKVHVAFPPGSALTLLPFVAVGGRDIPIHLLQCVLGACGVAAAYRMLAAARDRFGLPAGPQTLDALIVLYALGTMAWTTVARGGIYHWAHHLTLLGLCSAFCLALRGRYGLGGWAWGLAMASRVSALGAAPLLVYLAWRGRSGRPWWRVAALLPGPVCALGAMMWLNAARFDGPLDFGYAQMKVGPGLAADRDTYGVTSLHYLPRNGYTYFVRPPVRAELFPGLRSSWEGMAIWFVTPAFVLVFGALRRRGWMLAAWGAIVLTLTPALLYYNAGFMQWGCRFLLDVHPELLLLLLPVLGRRPKPWATALIAASMLCTFAGVWQLHLHWHW